jgi:hypothetical protein
MAVRTLDSDLLAFRNENRSVLPDNLSGGIVDLLAIRSILRNSRLIIDSKQLTSRDDRRRRQRSWQEPDQLDSAVCRQIRQKCPWADFSDSCL